MLQFDSLDEDFPGGANFDTSVAIVTDDYPTNIPPLFTPSVYYL